ncbi:MAG: Glycosyl transferase group 1 [Parcubacteria group bacterium GW2011_GWF2_45_11]|nr:MAG: Glycosyl transferase group 1 [Parcubacteria group bacterium GW2011_GWF2_45_11]
MKLLIYADSPYWGGAPLALLRIAKGLAKSGVKIHIMGQMTAPIHASLKQNPWIETVIPIEHYNLRSYLPKIRRCKIDLILGSSFKPDLGCAQIANALNLPLFWRMALHPKHLGRKKAPLKPAAVNDIVRTIGMLSDKIITVSDYLKKLFAGQGFEAHTIYNGCDQHLFRQNTFERTLFRSKVGLLQNEIGIGLVANYHPSKNHACLIHALSLLHSKNSRFKTYFIGDAFRSKMLSCQKEAKELVRRYQLQSNIFFLGFQESMSVIYNGLDVIVFPFIDEGCSNALLEAMACQKIVVANGSGSFPEIITHGKEGLIVPADSPEILSKALRTVIENQSDFRAMGAKARERVIRQFSLGRMIRNYKKFFLKN